MNPHPVKQAKLMHPDKREVLLLLIRHEKEKYDWRTAAGRLWESGVTYADEGAAIRALRVGIDSDPAMVGVDLTIIGMEAPPEERLAKKIMRRYNVLDKQDGGELANLEALIREETNCHNLIEHGETFIAYWFKNRLAYANALFPTVRGMEPRDVTGDGVALEFIEALGKATGRDYGNLKKILSEPPSVLMAPGGGKGLVQ